MLLEVKCIIINSIHVGKKKKNYVSFTNKQIANSMINNIPILVKLPIVEKVSIIEKYQ
jgi:hypothetical protein